MRVDEILKASDGELYCGNSQTEVAGISTDTRSIKPAEIFLAIRGKKYDGHSFVADALRQKAAGLIISTLTPAIPRDTVVIRVQNTLTALQRISSWHRKKFAIPVIAITGSNGKTTTKGMLASILSVHLRTLKSQASFNNEIGVPLTLLQITPRHQACILEIGMSAKGEIRNLAGIAKPNIGVITNVGPAHLANFSSVAEIAHAKGELLEVVADACILNADDEYFDALKEMCRGKLITFGVRKSADFHADRVREVGLGGISFRVNDEFQIQLNMCGKHNVYNALASIAAASCFNIDKIAIQESLRTFCPPTQRGEIKEYGTVRVVDDTYNANPASMRAAIALLTGPVGEELSRRSSGKGRRILVMGDMLELGDQSAESHDEIGRRIAKSKIDILFTIGSFAKFAAQAAIAEGMGRVFSCKSKQEVVKKLLSESEPYDTILIKGSRTMGMEEVVKGLSRLKIG